LTWKAYDNKILKKKIQFQGARMAIKQEKAKELLSFLKKKFPDWESFSNPRFVKEEVDYKHLTIKKALDLLSKKALLSLLEEKNYDEFIERLKKIGRDNNLLWYSVPREGDLNILYDEALDKTTFCQSMYELLYGDTDTINRFKKYLEYVEENNLPNKWTFPTYYLFVLYPDSEYFVKPETAKWFMEFLGRKDEWSSKPTSVSYNAIRSVVHELKDSINEYKPRDIVDIQGFIWVCAYTAKEEAKFSIKDEKKVEFLELFKEFIDSYPHSPEGIAHTQKLLGSREIGKRNFKEIVAASDRGEDITDKVLLKLLPYSDFESLRKEGAWISIAPVINANIKKWFENSGWTKSDDWPQISKSILDFLRRTSNNPKELNEACIEFSKLPYTKGFQAGMLSPILNALNPDEFKIINRKPINVINYLLGTSLNQTILEYPKSNEYVTKLKELLKLEMHQYDTRDMRDDDLLDMFCHWLNAVKKFAFREIQYWKIAPGENAWNWGSCLDGNFIAIGWDDLGDLSKKNRSEFDSRREELMKTNKDWKKPGVEQVWIFAKRIKEGDKVIANRGTTEAIGIGTVAGPYYYVPNVRHGHRLPVEWEDTKPHSINEGGWRRTLVKLYREKFEEVLNAPFIPPLPPSGSLFTAKTFNLLEELHQNPKRDFYLSHKADFVENLDNPFKEGFMLIGKRLPNEIREIMETEKYVFSRIPKNDFGRGGAWDYYWGAFYPKGGKRVEDAQLYMSIDKDFLRFGFYMGDYSGKQQNRFVENCKEYQKKLREVLEDYLAYDDFVFGLPEELKGISADDVSDKPLVKWTDWLENPQGLGINVNLAFSKDKALNLNKATLVDKTIETFKKLFPLVLMSVSEDPLSAINDYLYPEEELEIQAEYSIEQLSHETGIEVKELKRWIRSTERKGQAILYGPPGTGKTFVARKLAKHLIGGGDGFLEIVQFHPAYAYEDFIQGIRPQARPDGTLEYKMIRGRFLDFSLEARKRKDCCVLIIDEINRANLARVFGELMYLLEYRDENIPLAQGEHLTIPENVKLIGTMNTADRSIALVDHALRRRFAFLPLYPNFNILRKFHKDSDFPVEKLIEVLEKLNAEIDDKHYHVGITFFLNKNLKDNIGDIWEMEIEPYLEEYFYDKSEKVKEFRWEKIQEKIT